MSKEVSAVEGRDVRARIASGVTAVVLGSSLYLAAAQLARWAELTFAKPILASLLLAVVEVGLLVVVLCVAPGLSLVLARALGLPSRPTHRIGWSVVAMCGAASALVVYAADLAAWFPSAGATQRSALSCLVGACVASVGGLFGGLGLGWLARLSAQDGPAAAWSARRFAERTPLSWIVGLGTAVPPVAVAVVIRARLLDRPAICALVDVTALALAAVALSAVSGFVSRRLRGSPSWRVTGLALCGAALVGCVATGVYRALLLPTGVLDLAHVATCGALGIGVYLARPQHPPRALRWLAFATAALGVLALVAIERAPASFSGAPGEVRPARWVLVEGLTRIDLDGDGYAYFFGEDCDDFDARRRPNAPELPGNGIDDNCRGGDRLARLPWPARPSFVPLPADVTAPKRILLVTVDTLRADRLSAYGYSKATSPRLEALARESILFRRAYSSSPVTHFAFPMLMTGRLLSEIAWNHEVYPPGIRTDARTVAEILGDVGFKTAMFQSVTQLGRSSGIAQGFQHVDDRYADDPQRTAGNSDKMVDAALAWLEARRAERSFAWIHLLDPHSRYFPRPGVPDFGVDTSGRYDGEVFATDREIGRLLDGIGALGMSADTAVIVLSDHGELLGEHGATKHGGSFVWQEVLRVPLIVHVPGLPPRRVECVTEHRDVASTILNLVGIDGAREGLTSATLVPDLLGRCDPRREVVCELNDVRVVVGSRYKYVYRERDRSIELYDLVRDPRERRDLSRKRTSVVASMQSRLSAWEENRVSRRLVAALEEAVVSKLPTGARPIRARFPNGIDLVGVDLGPARVDPEHPLRAALYFRARRTVEDDCGIHLSVRRRRQRVRLYQSPVHEPVAGTLPFREFPPGRIVEDVFHLSCRNQSGRFALAVALSCGDVTVGALPARGVANNGYVQLGSIDVSCPSGWRRRPRGR